MTTRWQTLFCIIFFIIIGLPLIILPVSGRAKTEYNESRNLAIMPNAKIFFTHPKAFKSYLNDFLSDHLFFRTLAIKIHNYLYIKIYNASPNVNILVGKNNWLYCSSNNAFDDFTGKSTYSNEDLKKIKNNLEDKKKWSENNGIKFLVVVTPNKETLYPEALPDHIKRSLNPTKLDQILNYLKKNNSEIFLIDLRKALTRNKNRQLLFQETDSHWNNYGAYFAYQEIINNLKSIYPYMSPHDLEDFDIEIKQNSGDLAKMLFLENIYKENIPIINWEKSLSKNNIKYDFKNPLYLKTYSKNQNLPKIIVLRDSFGLYFIPFLSNHFREAIYTLSHIDNVDSDTDVFNNQKQIILKERPDILMYEITERALDVLLKK